MVPLCTFSLLIILYELRDGIFGFILLVLTVLLIKSVMLSVYLFRSVPSGYENFRIAHAVRILKNTVKIRGLNFAKRRSFL